MFVAVFYLLRQRGLDVSPNEWMTLLEGMEKGLHKSSLTGFYHLCRAIVVKSEVEFDRFDRCSWNFQGHSLQRRSAGGDAGVAGAPL